MITRNDIRELANFHSPEGCAVTFYFQPDTPPDKSHRQESLRVKDLIRNALHQSQQNGGKAALGDVERISSLMETPYTNGGKAKAIFACGKQGFWREFDLPPHLPATKMMLNQRFHLKPLAAILDGMQHICVVLVDRSKARIFEIKDNAITEKQDFVNELTRRGKSEGWHGYDGGHVERRQQHESMQHFKTVAEYIEPLFENDACDRLLVGCHDEIWPEIEAQLKSSARARLVGHFRVDPKAASPEEVKATALEALARHDTSEKQKLITEVIGEARSNGRGAVGLRRVLRSLEAGEVQTLLLGSNFQAAGVKCYHCGHMELHVTPTCAVCGKPNTRTGGHRRRHRGPRHPHRRRGAVHRER